MKEAPVAIPKSLNDTNLEELLGVYQISTSSVHIMDAIPLPIELLRLKSTLVHLVFRKCWVC